MNIIKNTLLLALASAALFVAAPVTSQDVRPGDPYPLKIARADDALVIHRGVPSLPVALIMGFRETRFVLPGDAIIRVEPVAVAIVGKFDFGGRFALPLEPRGELLGRFYLQAASFEYDFGKLCTSQLVEAYMDAVDVWGFTLLN